MASVVSSNLNPMTLAVAETTCMPISDRGKSPCRARRPDGQAYRLNHHEEGNGMSGPGWPYNFCSWARLRGALIERCAPARTHEVRSPTHQLKCRSLRSATRASHYRSRLLKRLTTPNCRSVMLAAVALANPCEVIHHAG